MVRPSGSLASSFGLSTVRSSLIPSVEREDDVDGGEGKTGKPATEMGGSNGLEEGVPAVLEAGQCEDGNWLLGAHGASNDGDAESCVGAIEVDDECGRMGEKGVTIGM